MIKKLNDFALLCYVKYYIFMVRLHQKHEEDMKELKRAIEILRKKR